MKGSVRTARRILGRLKKGDDLLAALTRECGHAGISLGEVRALGAVSKARAGFYDQTSREYRYFEQEAPQEILALVGNVSLKDGQPFVHAHVVFGDEQGRAWGGHLAEGTVVFACEFLIREYLAQEHFERRFDGETGLYLWGG